MLVSHAIQSVDEYLAKLPEDAEISESEDIDPTPERPLCLPSKCFTTTAESVADLKNPDKDRSATTDSFLAQITYYIERFQRGFEFYRDSRYETAYSMLSDIQIEYLRELASRTNAAMAELIDWIGEKRADDE